MSDADKPAEQSGGKTITVEQYNSLEEKFNNLYAKHVDTTKQIEAWTKLGDPDSLRGKLEDYTNLKKNAAGNDKEKIDQLILEARTEESNAWKGKVTEFETELKTHKDLVRNFTILQPTTEIASELFVKGALPLIKQHVQSIADVENGAPVIKGQDGKPLRSKEDPSKPMGIREYLVQFAKDNPDIASAKGTSGTGNSGAGNGASSSGLSVSEYMAMSADQRQALPKDVQAKLAPLALKALSKAN